MYEKRERESTWLSKRMHSRLGLRHENVVVLCFCFLSFTYAFVFVGDELGLFVPLEPHHEARVKPPRELLERLSGQELCFGAFHVVEHEEESFAALLAQELDRVVTRQWRLRIVRRRIYTYSRQICP